jgi:rhodanese-related sulfurtransferase
MKILAFFLVVSTLACQQQSPSHVNSYVVNPAAFLSAIDSIPNEILIDVRTPGEQQQGFIKDALFIDYKSDSFLAELDKLDKSKPVMVYCASGGRSGRTGKVLQELGFKNIYDLEGGMGAWKMNKLPVSFSE